MKSVNLKILSTIGLVVALPAISLSTAYASATGSTTTSTSASATSALSTTSADRLSSIISKGSAEIDRRLSTLNSLSPEISASTKLSSADKTTLTNEVTTELSGLTTLKATLAACNTISCAHTSAQSIFTDYRVYALIVPKVEIMSAADHQQQVEASLGTIASQLTTRLTGSSNTTLVSDLGTLKSDITSSEGLSSSVETNVVNLQPSDYDSNHSVLSQYVSSLKTAATDNQNALGLDKTIIQALKG
jgi:hypothetical protein